MEITIIGTATRSVIPTLATCHLTVSVEGTSKDDVIADATSTSNQLADHCAALDKSGELDTWSSGGLRTSTWQGYDNNGNAAAPRHSANASLTVTFARTDNLGDHLAQWAAIPHVSVSHVTWVLTDDAERSANDDLIAEALADATRRATAVATASGHTDVLEVLQIADPGLLGTNAAPEPPSFGGQRMAMYAADSGGDAIALKPAPIHVTVSLHVRYHAA